MPAKVADASVLGAIAFGEPRAEEAVALLQGAELYEPPLLAYELASIARKKALRHPTQRERVVVALGLALALEMRWVEVNHLEVLALALQTGLTTYDASYLYVAREIRAALVTFDDKLAQARRA